MSGQEGNAPVRIGCVPYLNAKPLIDWFHTPECDVSAEIVYAVPSELARQLDAGRLDVALVSIFEWFLSPTLRVVPNISISAEGSVKSVRLFSKVPFAEIRRVALDTSSLTSVALLKILLDRQYGLVPEYVSHPPDLAKMLDRCDAGLIIGDLKLFTTPADHILDLGAAWHDLTGLPFVYATWLAREEALTPQMTDALTRAKQWGTARLEELGERWAQEMNLPLDRVNDYFQNVMVYDLEARFEAGLARFRTECEALHLIPAPESGK